MHPILSHIHPAIRVALLSWLVARGGRYLALWSQGRAPHAHASVTPDASMPVDRLLHAFATLAGEHGAWVLTALAESAALLAILGIYHFCRKDTLPQTAERATWLFALSPMLLAGEFDGATLGASMGLFALGSAVHGRMIVGFIAALLATWCLPSVAIMTPALLGLSLRSRQPQTPSWAPWALGLSPIIGLTTLVFAGLLLAGIADVSLRAIASAQPALRDLDALQAGISPSLDDALFASGLLLAIACAWRFAENTPRSWPLLTIPLMLLPLLHVDSGALAPLAMLAAPLFAYAAKLTEDPVRERPLLATLAITSLLWVL